MAQVEARTIVPVVLAAMAVHGSSTTMVRLLKVRLAEEEEALGIIKHATNRLQAALALLIRQAVVVAEAAAAAH